MKTAARILWVIVLTRLNTRGLLDKLEAYLCASVGGDDSFPIPDRLYTVEVVRGVRAAVGEHSRVTLERFRTDDGGLVVEDARYERRAMGWFMAAVFTVVCLPARWTPTFVIREPWWIRLATALVAFALASVTAGVLLWPRGLMTLRKARWQLGIEWRLIAGTLLWMACTVASWIANSSGSHLQATIIRNTPQWRHALAAALSHAGGTALLVVIAGMCASIASDFHASRRRRRWWRVLAVRELERVVSVNEAAAQVGPEVVDPDAVRSLTRAARHIEDGLGRIGDGVLDPVAEELRKIGYAAGDTVRSAAEPLVLARPGDRARLAAQLYGWISAVIASDWGSLVADSVRARATYLWPERLRRAGNALRRVAWSTVTGLVGYYVWVAVHASSAASAQLASLPLVALTAVVGVAAALGVFQRD